MADDLGTRLVLAGLVTPELVADARAVAPPHDGALLAALVQRGLDEDAAARFFVTAGLGPLMEASDLANASTDVLAQLSPWMARELLAFPVRNTAAGLVVAMAAPSDPHAVAEIRRALGTDLLATTARVSDLLAALARAYPSAPGGAAPVPGSGEAERHASYRGSTEGAERADARAAVGPRLRLDDDEGVVPLVRQKPVRSPVPKPRAKVVTLSFERASEARPTEPTPPLQADPPTPVQPARQASPPPRSPLKSIIPPEHARWDLGEPGAGSPPPREASWTTEPAPRLPPRNKLVRGALDGVAPSRRSLRPPAVGGTLAAIRASRDRDEVVGLACAAALTVSRAAVLLALRKGLLQGWGGAGAGLSRDSVRNLWIPTTSPSMFRDVVRHAEPYVGRYGATAADGLFRAAVGGRGGRVVLQPVAVAGRVVSVLAADDVGYEREGVGRLELLARAVSEAFERLVVESKRR